MLRFVSEVEEGTDIVGMLMIGDPGIRVESAYLDSWLAGLLECVVAVREGADRHEVDLIEEAVPLTAEMVDGEVVLRFGAQTTRLGSLVSTVDTITVGVRELLHAYPLRNELLLHEIEARLAALTAPANEQ